MNIGRLFWHILSSELIIVSLFGAVVRMNSFQLLIDFVDVFMH